MLKENGILLLSKIIGYDIDEMINLLIDNLHKPVSKLEYIYEGSTINYIQLDNVNI
jgi:hypothetical protein